MAEAQYAPIHTIDPQTGFLESNAYLSAFDADRKLKFLEIFRRNGMGLYRTCAAIGLSVHTVNKHYQIDPVFKAAYDEAKVEYTDELEAVSRENALNPRSVIERIFQLKALKPERYADQKNLGSAQITINIDGKLIEEARKRSEVLDVEPIVSSQELATKPSTLSDSNSKITDDNRLSVE